MTKIFKSTLLLSFSLILLISLSFTTHTVKAASTSTATVIVEKLEIRNGAGSNYQVIGHLKTVIRSPYFPRQNQDGPKLSSTRKKLLLQLNL